PPGAALDPRLLSPSLVPLIGFISVGLGSAVLYLLRLALYSPDVRYGLRCPGHPQALTPHPQSLGGPAQVWFQVLGCPDAPSR
uniref:Uncharacterized protein n=1 Tax=Cyanistes caeruleus TaxID=156563 RepID=A0A8C0VMT4_CYACU